MFKGGAIFIISALTWFSGQAQGAAELCEQSYPVHLTFDDGPSPLLTPKILNILAKYRIQATFFILTSNFKNPAYARTVVPLVQRAVAEGHLIAFHGSEHISHTDLRYKNEQIEKNLTDIPGEITPYISPYFRFPYGRGWFRERNPTKDGRREGIMHFMQSIGKQHIGWDIDTWDWEDGRRKLLPGSLLHQVCNHAGGIILMHDIQFFTATYLEERVIKPLIAQRHEFKNLEEMRAINEREKKNWSAFQDAVVGSEFCSGNNGGLKYDQVWQNCSDFKMHQ